MTTHPAVFATLTAPSFGQVHRAVIKDESNMICHQHTNGRCRHGRSLTCSQNHNRDDKIVGTPLCKKCYRYKKAVIWNAESTKLWQRTTIYLRRQLAKILGLSEKELSKRIRVSYAKVIEFQRRGVVHIHVVIRLDDPNNQSSPPKIAVSPSQVELALRLAVNQVKVNFKTGGKVETIVWGTELDVREVNESMVGKVANYIAKYATKSSCESRLFDRRFKSVKEIASSGASEHLRAMALTAWQLNHDPAYKDLNLSMWAHDLGHRGHFLTKSVHYSVTFSYLRQLRQIWQDEKHKKSGKVANESFGEGERWHFVGKGWPFPCDSYPLCQERIEREEAREFMKEQFEQEKRLEVPYP